jgi:flagellar hook protein FlgE
MDISAIAIQGLNQADSQLQQAATAIASAGTQSAAGSNLDTVDLATEMVELLSARTLFAANLKTLSVASEIEKSAIDLKA